MQPALRRLAPVGGMRLTPVRVRPPLRIRGPILFMYSLLISREPCQAVAMCGNALQQQGAQCMRNNDLQRTLTIHTRCVGLRIRKDYAQAMQLVERSRDRLPQQAWAHMVL